ncbi:MAG: glycosyltransferase family 4 protein [Acidobacteriota bacterium]|nr:glycosyltransferase family 4 protein [Acidobacteriota bacterium]
MTTAARHLLVTNDFPPKVGGIQAYLWELWRRLDPEAYVVLTSSSHPDAAAFDAEAAGAGIRILRAPARTLLPTPATVRRVRRCAAEVGAGFLVVDPAVPLGLAAPAVGLPYAVVLHGAEVTVPGRLPVGRRALAAVLARSALAVCAGGYPAAEARRATGGRMPPVVEVPPGVDTDRFTVLDAEGRAAARRAAGIAEGALVVLSVSRLVPRKGMDVLVRAVAALAGEFPDLSLVVAGDGRDRRRLESMAGRLRAPVRFLGRVPDDRLAGLYGAADVFAMACRNRWGGLEQEGFGIVFLEAAAAGLPQVAGRSGGAHEAVADGETGVVVDRPGDPAEVARALRPLLGDPGLRRRMGEAARERARRSFDYDLLAPRLAAALDDVPG